MFAQLLVARLLTLLEQMLQFFTLSSRRRKPYHTRTSYRSKHSLKPMTLSSKNGVSILITIRSTFVSCLNWVLCKAPEACMTDSKRCLRGLEFASSTARKTLDPRSSTAMSGQFLLMKAQSGRRPWGVILEACRKRLEEPRSVRSKILHTIRHYILRTTDLVVPLLALSTMQLTRRLRSMASLKRLLDNQHTESCGQCGLRGKRKSKSPIEEALGKQWQSLRGTLALILDPG